MRKSRAKQEHRDGPPLKAFHQQTSADGRMATEAARLKGKRNHAGKNKTVLTRTGLLMEGGGTHLNHAALLVPPGRHMEGDNALICVGLVYPHASRRRQGAVPSGVSIKHHDYASEVP